MRVRHDCDGLSTWEAQAGDENLLDRETLPSNTRTKKQTRCVGAKWGSDL